MYIFKLGAQVERIRANACYAVWDCNVHNFITLVERIILYLGYTFGNYKFVHYKFTIQVQIICIVHRIGSTITKINTTPSSNVAYMYSFKLGAQVERIRANACYIAWDFNACKTEATIERIFSNACNAVGDFYACKAGAIIERIFSNACNAGRDFYTYNI